MSQGILPGDDAVISIRDGTIVAVIAGRNFPIKLDSIGTRDAIKDLIIELARKEKQMEKAGLKSGRLRKGIVKAVNSLIICDFKLTRSSLPMQLRFNPEPLLTKSAQTAAPGKAAPIQQQFAFSPA